MRNPVDFTAQVYNDMSLVTKNYQTILGDEDYDAGKYLITSPMGQGLLGKKVGDKVEIPVPKGTLKFEVLKIEYDL